MAKVVRKYTPCNCLSWRIEFSNASGGNSVTSDLFSSIAAGDVLDGKDRTSMKTSKSKLVSFSLKPTKTSLS